jgi:5-formyltetrahydrofolate cyclo-ligase
MSGDMPPIILGNRVGASVKMDKLIVRQAMKSRRDVMSLNEVINLSRAIEARLFSCEEFSNCQHLLFYLSFGNEVRTDEMITRSLKDRKRVYVPRLVPRERRMEVCEIVDMDQDFELGAYGIREPSRLNSKVVSPSKIDAVIAPGLAFDCSGRRVGFGGGYYDEFLRQLPERSLRLALAYGFQIVDSVPQDPWDERVQKIFSENDTINC